MMEIIERKMCQGNITTFEELANLLKSAKQKCSKEYCLKINPKNHWITTDYLNLMKTRDRKYVRWKQEEFRMAKNAVNDLRRKLKGKIRRIDSIRSEVTVRKLGMSLMIYAEE
ncbi:hypothetical protein HHI36_000542 [Cryptolaemus montrouzieri]|uniref:Uncharacterized protein n=1 Tax=Cryptolaemus montrouzieri TaxID=559131 RepID=A0ABD2P5F0_9CUCU